MTRDVFFFNTWYRGHNNPRYTELLPRLERVEPRLLTFPPGRLPRAASERAWRRVRGVVEPGILRRLQQRYPYAFVTDVPQLGRLHVPAVADVDDPVFDEGHAAALRRAAAYVVTDASAARRYEALGVDRPWHVVPQGVALEALDPARSAAIGAEHAADGAFVVGYVAAYLLLPGDRGGDNPLYDVSHLLSLWDEIGRRVPNARLWLVGGASGRVRERVAGRDDILLLGRVPQSNVLVYMSNFDVALYPRAKDQGIRAVKTAEYLGAGVPVVSYDYTVVDDLRAANAALLVDTPRAFAEAVERLAADDGLRTTLAANAKRAGAARDWRELGRRYAAILDEHLPALH